MADGSQPCSATFVDNVGNESPGKTPLKIDDNTFVFGHASDWYKMVSVDSLGNKIENRYMSSGSELTAANWEAANRGGSYSATNVQLCEKGHSAQYTALCPLYPIPYTLYPMPYTLYPICYTYTLYPIPYMLYPIPYTIYPTRYTLYCIPYTLCPIAHNLYPVPCTLYPSAYNYD